MTTLYTIGGILILSAWVLGLSIGKGLAYSEMKHKSKTGISICWKGEFYQVRTEKEMCELTLKGRGK